MRSDSVAGMLRVWLYTRSQSRSINGRDENWGSGNGRLSAVFAASVHADMVQIVSGRQGEWSTIRAEYNARRDCVNFINTC